jgi:hypothetical protein
MCLSLRYLDCVNFWGGGDCNPEICARLLSVLFLLVSRMNICFNVEFSYGILTHAIMQLTECLIQYMEYGVTADKHLIHKLPSW